MYRFFNFLSFELGLNLGFFFFFEKQIRVTFKNKLDCLVENGPTCESRTHLEARRPGHVLGSLKIKVPPVTYSCGKKNETI